LVKEIVKNVENALVGQQRKKNFYWHFNSSKF